METVVKVIFEILGELFWNFVAARPFTIFTSLVLAFLFGWVGFSVAAISGLLLEPLLWRHLGIDFETRYEWLSWLAIVLGTIALALAGLTWLLS